MTEMLFYIAGAAMMVGVFTLWCAISIERVAMELWLPWERMSQSI